MPVRAVNLARAVDRAAWGFTILACALVTLGYVQIARAHPESFGNDAIVYFRATAAWLANGDPWTVTRDGTTFAGIPPTLLLSLPLQPFGEEFARWFWPLSGLLAMILVVRRYQLSPLWILWPPVLEGGLRGNPDYSLMGLVMLGGGAIAVVAKPYSAPFALWERGWASLVGAIALGIATFPLLPWPVFIRSWPSIRTVLEQQTGHLSAWGNPVLLLAVAVALLLLRRDGIPLWTPGLWPNSQMHYAIWSIRIAARSPVLTLGLAMPFSGAAGLAIVAHTAAWLIGDRLRRARPLPTVSSPPTPPGEPREHPRRRSARSP